MARRKEAAEPSKYLSIAGVAALLDVSNETARRLVKGVQEEVGPGRRYSEYVIAGHGKTLRVSAAAIVDYSKYSDALEDPAIRTTLKPFDIVRVERDLGIRQSADPALLLDYDALASAVISAFFKAGQVAAGQISAGGPANLAG